MGGVLNFPTKFWQDDQPVVHLSHLATDMLSLILGLELCQWNMAIFYYWLQIVAMVLQYLRARLA